MKPHYLKPLNRTALLGVLVWVVLIMVTGAAWAQSSPVPFECTGESYIIQGSGSNATALNRVVDTGTAFGFFKVNIGEYNRRINNLGYNPVDNLLYAFQWSTSTNGQIVKIDANGDRFAVTSFNFFNGIVNLNSGDVTPDGSNIMYLSNSGGGAGNNRLYVLDLIALTFDSYPIVGSTGNYAGQNVNDLAVHPTNGHLYGCDQVGTGVNGQLAIIDPTPIGSAPNQTVTRIDVDFTDTGPGLLPGGATSTSGPRYGAAMFNPAGNLLCYENGGTIYEIALNLGAGGPTDATPTVVRVSKGNSSVDNDGAACAAAEPATAIDIQKTVCLGEFGTECNVPADGSEFVEAMNGEAVTYFFEITNIGDLALNPVDFSDTDLSIDYTTVDLVTVSDDRVNGSLAPGGKIILAYQTTADENLVFQGSLVNTACADGTAGQDTVSDCDPAIVLVPELCADPEDPSDGEGCTPGYWKAKQHYDSWPDAYTPDSNFLAVFGAGQDISFEEALKIRDPRGEGALIRHAVAALLNAASLGVDYLYTEAEVIAWVQHAYATGDYESHKDHLEMENQRMCLLN